MRVVIAHGHMFKNAGSTFDWSLERNFGDDFLDHRDDKVMRQRGDKHILELLGEHPDLKAISSHHLYQPLPDIDDIHFEPVFMLRHPIERIASVYAFERQQDAETRGAKAAKSMNFRRYIAWRMQLTVPRTVRDYQTYYMGGRPVYEAKSAVSFRTLNSAVENLSNLSCVGVVDRYDESMVVFETVLRRFFPDIDLSYIKQNVTKPRLGKKVDLESKVDDVLKRLGKHRSEILSNNSYDLCLYRAANQKLTEAIAGIADFDTRLAGFYRRCERLQGSNA